MKWLVLVALIGWLATSAGGANAADVFGGQRIYQSHCAGCHGARGRPELPGAPDFSRGDGLMRGDLAVLDVVAEGQRAMPGYRGVLSNEEMLDVIAYLRTLH